MPSLDGFAEQKLAERTQQGTLRELRPVERRGRQVQVGGALCLNFASNDYLGLSTHPDVVQAAVDGAHQGAGATASRLVVGTDLQVTALEAELARFKGTPAACLFASGYHANLGVIPALVGPEDLVVVDAQAHACLWSGIRLSGATVQTVPHNRPERAMPFLREHRPRFRHLMLVTEGVFSMDGDLAPLDRWADLGHRFDGWLLVDDAHGTGVTGEGRGSVHAFGLDSEAVPLQVGTFSKALGGLGGFVAASTAVVALMANRARTLVYSTGLPPSVVAAGRAALRLVQVDPAPRHRLAAHRRQLAEGLGLELPPAAICPIHVGNPGVLMGIHSSLQALGLHVPAMRSPTVPQGTDRLRVSLSALHTSDDIGRLVEALKDSRVWGDVRARAER